LVEHETTAGDRSINRFTGSRSGMVEAVELALTMVECAVGWSLLEVRSDTSPTFEYGH
jgi:hypothetical protein